MRIKKSIRRLAGLLVELESWRLSTAERIDGFSRRIHTLENDDSDKLPVFNRLAGLERENGKLESRIAWLESFERDAKQRISMLEAAIQDEDNVTFVPTPFPAPNTSDTDNSRKQPNIVFGYPYKYVVGGAQFVAPMMPTIMPKYPDARFDSIVEYEVGGTVWKRDLCLDFGVVAWRKVDPDPLASKRDHDEALVRVMTAAYDLAYDRLTYEERVTWYRLMELLVDRWKLAPDEEGETALQLWEAYRKAEGAPVREGERVIPMVVRRWDDVAVAGYHYLNGMYSDG